MSMNSRDFLSLAEQIPIAAEELRNALIDTVARWTEKEIKDGNDDERLFFRFLDYHPEWDRPALYDLMESEIERVRELVGRERAL